MKHVTLKWSDDWSTDVPLYTSQLDMIVASKLDTRGLHLDSDDTPKEYNTLDWRYNNTNEMRQKFKLWAYLHSLC